MTGWRRVVLAAGLGVLATASMPPFNFVVLLVPAFSGLAWLTGKASGRLAAFAVGWWFGFGFFVSGVYWTAISMLVKPGSHAWMIPFALFGLPAVLALFPACATLLTRVCGAAGAGRILIFAAAWTAMEWVRSWIFTGFPWNLIATAWSSFDSMMQFAAVGGAYGLGLLSVIVAAMPAVFAEGDGSPGRKIAAVAAAVAVLAMVWGGGLTRLESANEETVPGVRLRLVQPNIDQKLKWKPELRRDHVLKQLAMSVSAPKDESMPPPTHIIWAETAVPFSLVGEPKLLELIGSAAPTGGLMIVGAPRITPPQEEPFQVWNSLHAITPEGEIVATYDKAHLVPFGEYVPFGNVLKIAKITMGRGFFTPGTGPKTLQLPGLPPVSPLICYEVIFPGQVVDRNRRPAWMLNITNDGWYGRSSGPYQHFAAARLRAVEEGLPLVRVANTGISAVVDAYGRTRASLGLGDSGVVDSALPVPLKEQTLYGRFGDWVVLLMIAAVFLAGLLPAATRALAIGEKNTDIDLE